MLPALIMQVNIFQIFQEKEQSYEIFPVFSLISIQNWSRLLSVI